LFGSLIRTYLEGARLNAIVIAAIDWGLADLLEQKPMTVRELGSRAGVSERGCQAIADGLVALKLWRVEAGVYRNTPAAQATMVRSAPGYVGEEHPELFRRWSALLSRIGEVVQTGLAPYEIDDPRLLEFWSLLTPSLARGGAAVAEQVVEMLGLARGSPRVIDIGGGAAGLYAKAILISNARARVTQVDWPHINAEARDRLAAAGVVDRFRALDGDFRELDFGREHYDVAVLSHVMHQESAESNRALLEKIAKALKPGAKLVISDWVVDDGRAGPPSALIFNTTMLLLSQHGKSYERREIADLLLASGFQAPEFTPSVEFATLAISSKK
jgi:SAM-dependent methyltransferase